MGDNISIVINKTYLSFKKYFIIRFDKKEIFDYNIKIIIPSRWDIKYRPRISKTK